MTEPTDTVILAERHVIDAIGSPVLSVHHSVLAYRPGDRIVRLETRLLDISPDGLLHALGELFPWSLIGVRGAHHPQALLLGGYAFLPGDPRPSPSVQQDLATIVLVEHIIDQVDDRTVRELQA